MTHVAYLRLRSCGRVYKPMIDEIPRRSFAVLLIQRFLFHMPPNLTVSPYATWPGGIRLRGRPEVYVHVIDLVANG